MKLRHPLLLIFCLVVIAAGVVAYSFIPTVLLTPAVVLSIVILSLSVGVIIYLPISTSRDANIGLIGPSSVAGIFFVLTSAGVLAASFALPSGKAFALSFVNLALFAVVWVILRFAAERIEAETVRATRSDVRRGLAARIKQLSMEVRDPLHQRTLQRIAEEVSHSSDSAFQGSNKLVGEIELLVSKIESFKGGAENSEVISLINSLDSALKSLKIELDSARL